MDLHAGQIQGFFSVPVDELSALRILSDYFLAKQPHGSGCGRTDLGSAKRHATSPRRIRRPLAIIEKRRSSGRSETLNVIGEVKGKRAIMVDDEIDTGSSVMSDDRRAASSGAPRVLRLLHAPHSFRTGGATAKGESAGRVRLHRFRADRRPQSACRS